MSQRLSISVRGTVQGVGFRPFVWRTAQAHGLRGWVRNGTAGVRIEVEGEAEALCAFVTDLRLRAPVAAAVESIEVEPRTAQGSLDFQIQPSTGDEARRPVVPADLAVCDDCLAEIETAGERRHRYPFTNCTHCGPRYTILNGLPYDRPRTSMHRFEMCADCEREYRDPADRRFHAQPIACPRCGPRLQLLAPDGRECARDEVALDRAVAALRRGAILALRGLGGFQLLVDAQDAGAVRRLRARKHRPDKPLAVLFPDLDVLRRYCVVSRAEARVLCSPEAPILILGRHLERPGTAGIAAEVAPGNPTLGAMLPTSPLHVLLARSVGTPVVCTSGNLSEEPLCIDTQEALDRLSGVADFFLTHDRPVLRPVDDSVGRVEAHGLVLLRRARGFVPRPIRFASSGPTVLAVGGHLKCTLALAVAGEAVLSQHLGDLDGVAARALHQRTAQDLLDLFAARPEAVACDLHPDYASRRVAEELAHTWGVPLVDVQHHHAHVVACMAEHGLEGPVLGLAWDGSGFGPDGSLWGGEALVADAGDYERVASLRTFPLPGGERAVREPRRSALGLVYEMLGEGARGVLERRFAGAEMDVLLAALGGHVQAPRTSSIGRLFDAVAALAGLRDRTSFEGQAAMELEFASERASGEAAYPLPLVSGTPVRADWEPLVRAVLGDVAADVPATVIGARFHLALVEFGFAVAVRAGLPRVVLSGGCFQNRLLQDGLRQRLQTAGFEVYTHQRVPANDGGLALGQVVVATAALERCRPAGGDAHVSRHSRQGALGR